MILTRVFVLRSSVSYLRSLGVLALLTSACAGGQSLNLAIKEPVLPGTESPAAATLPGVGEAVPGRMLASATSSSGYTVAAEESSSAANSEDNPLPDSPSATLAVSAFSVRQPAFAESPGQFNTQNPKDAAKTPDGRPIASLYTKYIPAGWAYQPIHGRDKLILGARDFYSFGNILAIFVSAGYSHLANGQPNYGVNSEAFAKRLGATAIRETTEGIFTDGVFAVMFHQDPRYFAEGPKYSYVHRALYAATRPIIVRTTNGTGSTVNSSLLAGYAAAAVLNNAYYPQINRNVKDTFSSYGTSLGGAALGFVVSEFTDDALQLLHLKRKP